MHGGNDDADVDADADADADDDVRENTGWFCSM